LLYRTPKHSIIFVENKVLKTKSLVIIAAIGLAIISFLYFRQGGLNKVSIEKINTTKRYVIGKKFEGNVSGKGFADLFDEIKKLKSDSNLNGHLGNIFYNNPEKSEGEIKAFFGVISNQRPNPIEGYKTIELIPENYIQGSINASGAFVNKTYNAIFEYAEQNNITLDEKYIEWFPSENEIVVQIKIKE